MYVLLGYMSGFIGIHDIQAVAESDVYRVKRKHFLRCVNNYYAGTDYYK